MKFITLKRLDGDVLIVNETWGLGSYKDQDYETFTLRDRDWVHEQLEINTESPRIFKENKIWS